MDTITVTKFENIKGVKYSRFEVVKRIESRVGEPFEHIPGNPPSHHVLMELENGTRIRVEDVEMVYNDAKLMNYGYGDGVYEANVSPLELRIFELARELYKK